MLKAGVVSLDTEKKWIGGRYYLQHLVKCNSLLLASEQVELRDVWWVKKPEEDPFSEVRAYLGESITVRPSSGIVKRLSGKIRRVFGVSKGSSDLFREAGLDVFFPIPPCENSGMPYVFWLPDFQYLRRPDLMSETLRSDLEKYFHEHVHAANRIVLSSDDARNDFAKVFPQFIDRTHVVKFCSVPDDDWYSLVPEVVAEKYKLPRRFFIVCNQFTRHKNHLTLVDAMKMLSEQGILDVHLVCTGSTFDHRQEDYVGEVTRVLEDSGLTGNVHILGLIPRADQIALLRRSIAVLQPSWFEGWSTIIEDAKTLGKPVLASDLPVHREQLGAEHAYLLGLDDSAAWADAMAQLWRKLEAGPDLVAEAEARIKLQVSQRECGLAFTSALKAAVPDLR
ncbi:MAG: glycosyltransferase family 4 protein [Arenimonas sp.]